MRIHSRFFPLGLITLALSGCSWGVDPTFMPSGYTYHSEYYKAPPGPEIDQEIGYPYDAVANAAVVQQWRAVSKQIVEKMEADLGIAAQPVYVATIPDQNAFNASADYALRAELRERGYTLVSSKANVLNIKPEAYLPEDERVPVDANEYNGDPDIGIVPKHRELGRDFLVKLTLSRNTIMVGQVEGYYKLQAYGYIRGEGQDRISAQPKAGRALTKPRTNAPDVGVDESSPENILAPGPQPVVTQEPL